MVGEKYLNPDDYETGRDPCDDHSAMTGDDYDPAVILDLDYWVLMPR